MSETLEKELNEFDLKRRWILYRDHCRTLESRISSSHSRESAYREALKTILADKSLWLKDDLLWIRDIARAALDRGPEEPVVGREVTLEEVTREIYKAIDSANISGVGIGQHAAGALLTTFRVERR